MKELESEDLLARIVKHEGFESRAYPDPLSGAEPYTFGHGLTYITEAESLEIVRNRIDTLTQEILNRSWGDAIYWGLSEFPVTRRAVMSVLIEMAFQMGVAGVSKFEKMLAALIDHNYKLAAEEMLDSKWARQTPTRAQALAKIIREIIREI